MHIFTSAHAVKHGHSKWEILLSHSLLTSPPFNVLLHHHHLILIFRSFTVSSVSDSNVLNKTLTLVSVFLTVFTLSPMQYMVNLVYMTQYDNWKIISKGETLEIFVSEMLFY